MAAPALPQRAARPLRVGVIGGGWAGLAAAVEAVSRGHHVTLFEMAPRLGGRARALPDGVLDNGQHILIGAYRQTLEIMRRVGVDPAQVLQRLPLALVTPDGRGLRLPPGPPLATFGWAVMRRPGWSLRERLGLLGASLRWAAMRFTCPADWSVATLCESLSPRVRAELIDPLCVAALNTPADRASATVFLCVLKDALFGGAGAADLLLPRRPLSALLPEPAGDWLRRHGATLRVASRVQAVSREGHTWLVQDERFDAVVLAASATEASRLAQPLAPQWAAQTAALQYEPIVTVYLESAGSRLPLPMLQLHESDTAPAQFLFDHGALGGTPGRFAAVVSGAAPWTARGLQATGEAVQAQLLRDFPADIWRTPPSVKRVVAERRATFACTPSLQRPPVQVAPGLWAAGDYVQGPYPATLEGAVRAGIAAVHALENAPS
ncbi:hydroxysqualene dehydroxylase HpnE [Azohydromonas lata]|uniref:Hydroxysqualene dehydroxylase HpnE n=1 Tax=Azohydromonas lata TaxID=45677 RepID=A0ABU5IL00_9BURK|nr:hydroxysqualene dehydroxylase HpnE [Azohydromonas lata]MDZ5459575.1 hydroxysqualene dehydroxylase HpnE [Azohydromonas lata]